MAQPPFSEFAGNKRLLWIAEEWQRNADDMAIWAMERLVNRRDVWGQYTLKSGEVHVVTLPIKERRDTGSDMVTLNKLRRHFGGRAVSHLIGLHVESDHETCKWFAIDVDLHDETIANADEIALANLAACREWATRLREKMLDPCIIDSNGIGGFHLLVLLDGEYPVADVHEFIAELRSDYERFGLLQKPELFPSKPKPDKDERLGNWLRLPGRHHTRPHYSRVWNFDAVGENEWLEGSEAIEAIISLRPAALPQPSEVRKLARRIAPKQQEPLSRKPRVCVDLDGVLAKYDGFRGRDHIGVPLPGALEFAWALAKVADIIIFSARCSQDNAGEEPSRLSPAQLRIRVIDWLEKYKFPYTDVYVGQGKPRVAAFIDDRAINCSPQTDSEAFDKTLDSLKGLLYGRPKANGKPPEPSDRAGKKLKSEVKAQASAGGLLKISKEKLAPPASIVKSVQQFYSRETGDLYADDVVLEAVNKWLEMKFETEDLEELLTTPHLSEAKVFRRILEETAAVNPASEVKAAKVVTAEIDDSVPVFSQDADVGDENLFNGFRQYSPEKLSAMIAYFAEKGKKIYKTKLNKLLFYADFVNFHVNGRSISGANYVHIKFGPVPDQYEHLLKKLTSERELEITPVKTQKGTANQIKSGAKARNPKAELSPQETATLDWILSNYGQMTSEEIMESSHNEKAYRNTRAGEKIAYGYAQFLGILPEKKEKL
jgi:uncharacterized phage-associated protein